MARTHDGGRGQELKLHDHQESASYWDRQALEDKQSQHNSDDSTSLHIGAALTAHATSATAPHEEKTGLNQSENPSA